MIMDVKDIFLNQEVLWTIKVYFHIGILKRCPIK